MGYLHDRLKREAQPHGYVVSCDGSEIGSAATADEATLIARQHAQSPLVWRKRPALWWAAVGDRLYEIRKLKIARDVGMPAPQSRRR